MFGDLKIFLFLNSHIFIIKVKLSNFQTESHIVRIKVNLGRKLKL